MELKRTVPFCGLFKTDRIGMWSLSVPPDVKYNFSAGRFNAFAQISLASSSFFFASSYEILFIKKTEI